MPKRGRPELFDALPAALVFERHESPDRLTTAIQRAQKLLKEWADGE